METKKLVLTVAGVALVTSAVVGVALNSSKSNNSGNNDSVITPTTNGVNPTSSTNATSFKDGSYSAEGSYATPGGTEKVAITLMLKDNVITDISLETKAKDRTSQEYQALFASGYKAKVQGKKISEVKLDRVSGSSLTSAGFNKALDAIKQNAKS